jgi:hydrogenase nickel incorporation protein HypB
MEIKMVSNLLKANDAIAQQNRKIFKDHKVTVVNIMSSPGAGKTTLLEKTIEKLADRYRVGVIEGDVASDDDSQRLGKLNVQVVQINTINLGGACHLDSSMIQSALDILDLDSIDLLFVENVGNLICPSGFDLGEDARAVILSIPEGDDKPAKYPTIFRKTNVLVLSKSDLLPYSNFNRDRIYNDLKKLNDKLKTFELSALKDEGMEPWIQWLEGLMKK